jgi:hypothetical protein
VSSLGAAAGEQNLCQAEPLPATEADLTKTCSDLQAFMAAQSMETTQQCSVASIQAPYNCGCGNLADTLYVLEWSRCDTVNADLQPLPGLCWGETWDGWRRPLYIVL